VPALADQAAVVEREGRLVRERRRQELVQVVEGCQLAGRLGDRGRRDRGREAPDVLQRRQTSAKTDQVAGVGLAERRAAGQPLEVKSSSVTTAVSSSTIASAAVRRARRVRWPSASPWVARRYASAAAAAPSPAVRSATPNAASESTRKWVQRSAEARRGAKVAGSQKVSAAPVACSRARKTGSARAVSGSRISAGRRRNA